uniref:Uncharacterized protein n=1 Tax=Cacopsylla melanoneura TaxID=428564 RepID=A0A8D8QIE0_9HEMI
MFSLRVRLASTPSQRILPQQYRPASVRSLLPEAQLSYPGRVFVLFPYYDAPDVLLRECIPCEPAEVETLRRVVYCHWTGGLCRIHYRTDGDKRASSEYDSVTNHGVHVVGIHRDGNSLDNTGGGGCLHWVQAPTRPRLHNHMAGS